MQEDAWQRRTPYESSELRNTVQDYAGQCRTVPDCGVFFLCFKAKENKAIAGRPSKIPNYDSVCVSADGSRRVAWGDIGRKCNLYVHLINKDDLPSSNLFVKSLF